MANIIITIISIGLVAIAATMSLYYGGTAHKTMKIKAQAATIKSQILSINMAQKMSRIDGNSVGSIADLVNDGYLTSIPSYEGSSWNIVPPDFNLSVSTEGILTAELCVELIDMFDVGQINCTPGQWGFIDFTY